MLFTNNTIWNLHHQENCTKFRVSNPDATIDSPDGVGATLDNKTGLVKIGILIDSTTSHEISYDGFSKNSFGDPVTNVTAVTEEPLYKYFAAASNVDMYNASSTQKGFRIKGGIKLKHIFGSDIGGEQSTPHTLQYTYERDPFMGTPPTATSNAVKIYIDNLTGPPIVALKSDETDTAIVKSVMWCMGIPSVNEMTIHTSNILKYKYSKRIYTWRW